MPSNPLGRLRPGKYAGEVANPLSVRERPNQSQATQTPPQENQGQAQTKPDYFTHFTKSVYPTGGEVIYQGDRNWVLLTFLLETAGPVAVGQRSKITPVLSGQGQLLITNVPKTMKVAKGTRIYIASTAVNRVQVSIEPLPWLEQITATLGGMLTRLVGA